MDNYEESVDVDVIFSRKKLQQVADSLRPWISTTENGSPSIQQLPCTTVDQTISYRCRCTFQIIWTNTEPQRMNFAVRENHVPVLIADSFPVANRRIQLAMATFQTTLNDSNHREDFHTIKYNLTSVAFSSAWSDSDDCDCLVTLFYDKSIQDGTKWKNEATRLCRLLEVTQVSGRSRKQILRSIDNLNEVMHDTLWLINHNNAWLVQLVDPFKSQTVVDKSCIRTVKYEKPEGTFFHPNATAMCTALDWLIRRIGHIHKYNSVSSNNEARSRLLELYCGCGAHTVALMQTQILESIAAVEIDERLVHACERNVAINQSILEACTSSNKGVTVVNVVSSDAGIWAKKYVDRANNETMNLLRGDHYDILLVDPPRQGLDENVCRMANDGSFRDFLYISCGRDALIRDLQRLSQSFEVVDCKLVDLFPRTEAVESLMHLRRRTE